MEPIILASESPQRQEFFRLLGLPFTVVPSGIDERAVTAAGPRKLAEALAVRKVQDVAERVRREPGPRWIFGADTIVAIGREVFGKPEDRNDAARILRRLAGRGHKVITAMALYNTETKTLSRRSAACTVTFARLPEAEINWYLDTNEWRGAAGGYRLQGRGGCFITSVKGSPSNVAGLPLRDFYAMLKFNGYPYGA